MSSERQVPLRQIAIGVRLGDAALRERLALEIADTPDLVWSDDVADVLIADSTLAAADAGPVVLVAAIDPVDVSPLVRALLPPGASPRTIVSAARLVAEGLSIRPDAESEHPATADLYDEDGGPTVALTPREKEVLQLLAVGASNKAIARKLDVSVHTVKFHVASLLRKLGADGRLELVGIGLRTGLLML